MDSDSKFPASSSASHIQRATALLKQSSCELNSRLKTRKLLGVGETNDGDVHRSKLSQILGHSEQLYFKEPKGLRFWQLLSSILYTCLALVEFVYPGSSFSRPQWTDEETKAGVDPVTPRLYAAALLSLSFLLWRSFLSLDRELMRASLSSSLLYSAIHVTVFSMTWLMSSSSSSSSSSLSVDHHQTVVSVVFSSNFLQLVLAVIFFGVSLFFYRSTIRK